MHLETQRLLLKPITEQDWPLFKALHLSDSVMQYVSDQRDTMQIEERFKARLKKWEPKGNGWLTLTIEEKTTGEKLGVTGFFAEWQPYQQAELGFLLLPMAQGKGYGQESTRALLEYLFEHLGYNKAIATVTSGNEAPANLMTKLGFTLEGVLRENFKLNQLWYDDLKFGLLKREFR